MTTAASAIRARERGDLAQQIRRRISGEVRFDPFSRVLYSTDASIYQMEPVGVVIPRNTEDVLAVMEMAQESHVPVLPRGAGTSLADQSVNHAIVMDFSKYMDQLLEVNQEERWARVQPGIVLEQLNQQLASYNLQFAPDPTTANRATVGGSIGNNTCGAHSVIYGKTLDHVLELDVALSDATGSHFGPLSASELHLKLAAGGLGSEIYGAVSRLARENQDEIEARFPKIMRRVSGYNLDEFTHRPRTAHPDPYDSVGDRLAGGFNLSRMVVGSEGTLCVITEAKVNLVPRPPFTGVSVVHLNDIFQGGETTAAILVHQPSAIELVDRMVLDRCRESRGLSQNLSFLEGDPGALLLVEFYGNSEKEVAARMDSLKLELAGKKLGYGCINLLGKAAQNHVWSVRKSGLGLLMSIHGTPSRSPS